MNVFIPFLLKILIATIALWAICLTSEFAMSTRCPEKRRTSCYEPRSSFQISAHVRLRLKVQKTRIDRANRSQNWLAIPSPVQALNGLYVLMANRHRVSSFGTAAKIGSLTFFGPADRWHNHSRPLEIFFINFRGKLYLGIYLFFRYYWRESVRYYVELQCQTYNLFKKKK